jgi:hypothetical protein
LKDNPQGMSRTQISRSLGRVRRSEEITEALEALRTAGLAACQKRRATDGRLIVEIWYAADSPNPAPDTMNSSP